MMWRNCLAGLFFVCALVFTFSGCSDDKGVTTITGDPNAPEFQNMKAAIATTVDSTLATVFRFAADPRDLFPVDTTLIRPELGIMNPEDTVMYNYVGGWNILYLNLTTGVEYNRILVDSARFLENGLAVQQYSWHATNMDYIRHRADSAKGTETDYQEYAGYVNVQFPDYHNADQRVQGVARFILNDYSVVQSNTVHDQYDFGITITAMGFNSEPLAGQHWTTLTPKSGSFSMAGAQTGSSGSANWTVTVTFVSDGSAQVRATTGNTVYPYTMTPAYQ
jgi:hypothetical protein